jgi:tripartite-type tricarboxylate transporter receptor subunit TctC
MHIWRFILTLVAALALVQHATAQTYPDKSRVIRIIVPTGASSSGDLQARALARGMADVAGLNVIVENKAGAEGVIGMQAGKLAPPDGYTLVQGGTSTMVLNAVMLPNLAYDPVADFVPVAGLSRFSLVLNTGSSLPFRTLREFIDDARRNPGKYSYASASATTRMAMEMLERQAGLKLLSVPFKTMAEATSALAGGQVDLLMNDVATAVPFYQSGRLHPLAVTGAGRMYAIPDVPTLREQGVADYELNGWFAMYFPANTPPALVAAMREIMVKASKTQYMADVLKLASFEPLDLSPQQLGALLRNDIDKWRTAARASGAGK